MDEAEAAAELALATATAALDDSDEGRALLRYEGQHGREFRATLNQLIKLTKAGANLVDDTAEAGAVSMTQAIDVKHVVSETASPSGEAAGPAPAAPNKATEAVEEGPPATVEAGEEGPDEAVGAIGGVPRRARRARSPRSNK